MIDPSIFSGLLGVGLGNEAVDVAGTKAISETDDILLENMDDSIDPYSQETEGIQKELIEQGYGDHLGETGADGRMGKHTRYAMALRDQDNARTLLEQEQLSNKNELLSGGRTGVTKDAEGWQTPVYSSPFNRFG